MGENCTLTNNRTISNAINDYVHIDNDDLVEMIIPEGVTHIRENAFLKCRNLKRLVLPESLVHIGAGAFSNCTLLEQVDIPAQVSSIAKGAFLPSTKLVFKNGLTLKGLVELVHNNKYIGDYKLYVLDDGTYYIEQGDKIITITKKYIDGVCSHSKEIRDILVAS